MILRWVISDGSGISAVSSVADVHAVRHRVVHGGEHFTNSVLISDEVLRGIEDCIELAPLHNPANIEGITAARVWDPERRKWRSSTRPFIKRCPNPPISCRINSTAATAFAATVFTAPLTATSLTAIEHTAGREGQISADTSRVAVYVIPTNEELLIARDTVRVVSGASQRF